MNYWHMQLHPNDRHKFGPNKVMKLIKEKNIIGLGEGWKGDKGQPNVFTNEMQIGDVVLIRSDGPLALVKIIGPCEDNYEQDVWFDLKRKIEILSSDGELFKTKFHQKLNINWSNSLYLPITIANANKSQFILFWYKTVMSEMQMKDNVELLKYKKQIILQGPPGTGKTRQAKLIADELIKPQHLGNPESIIDNLVQQFRPDDKLVRSEREKSIQKLAKFNSLFPKENLNKLTLDAYCTGRGDQDNFCWWLEWGLRSLGAYSPGSAMTYLIYWNKDLEEYSKHGFIEDISDDQVAIQKVADLIYQVVNEQKLDNITPYFRSSFLLKLLNSYYPDIYFPINSERMLNNALKIFNVDYRELTTFEKNKKLNQIYLDKKNKFKSQITACEFSRLLLDNFNLKTGDDINLSEELVAQGESQLVQFHPSYSYEDFVRGIVAKSDNGKITYQVENRILAEFAQRAKDNPNGNYVLIIDEINRANLASVLGELIYALEYRGECVTSMYEFDHERDITLPKNLYIIGTMNTADRSVGHIDYAIRRRFAFVDVLPDENVIDDEQAKDLFNRVKELFTAEFLSADFKYNEVMIGHSYFLAKDDELKTKLQFEIKPILREYLKDGILLETASTKIEDLNV